MVLGGVYDLRLTGMKRICQRRQMARKADVEGIINAVESAEKLTSAEFVVALEPRSGSYRDIDLFFAVSLNFIGMLLAFFGPIVFFSGLGAFEPDFAVCLGLVVQCAYAFY